MKECPKGYKVVFARYVIRRDGKIIYPKKAKVLRFFVKEK